MNYERLKEILKNNKYSAGKAALAIKRTEAWFHRAVKNDTMTIKDLEKLLKLCKTNLFEFFGGVPTYSEVNEPSARESVLKEEVHELLKENRKLRLDIEELHGKKEPVKAKPKAY